MAVHPPETMTYRPREFAPPWYWRNRHVQTIAADIAPRRLAPMHEAWQAAGVPTEVALSDGDRLLTFAHFHADDPARLRPVVVHLHGLEGSAEANTQRGLSAKAFAAGLHSLRVNFRNCGDTEHLARHLYNGRRTEDLHEVLAWLRGHGFRRIFLTGASLGANLVLLALAEAGDEGLEGVERAVAISPPIHFPSCAPRFCQGFNRFYDAFFLASLKRKIRRKLQISPMGSEQAERVRMLRRIRTLQQFDEAITAPAFGYADAMAYYQDASSADHLGRIRVRTLILHAQDDPILPIAMFEARQALIAANPRLSAVFPRHGGHVGFYQPLKNPAAPWMDGWWAEDEAIAFLIHAP